MTISDNERMRLRNELIETLGKIVSEFILSVEDEDMQMVRAELTQEILVNMLLGVIDGEAQRLEEPDASIHKQNARQAASNYILTAVRPHESKSAH